MLLIFCLGILAACGRAPEPRHVPPEETLLRIVAEFQRYAATDIYRFGMPRDDSGQNAFRATIARLDALEPAELGENADIAAFTRAEALFRLGTWTRARDSYSRAAAGTSPLAARARERAARCEEMIDTLRLDDMPDERVRERLDRLEKQHEKLLALQTRWAPTPDAPQSRRETEQAEIRLARYLFQNRHLLEHGARRALDAATAMIAAHEQSNRVFAHRLTLGRFLFELARETETAAPADGMDFDASACLELAAKAREQFTLVSRADGREEKLEGIAELQSLDAFTRRVRRWAE